MKISLSNNNKFMNANLKYITKVNRHYAPRKTPFSNTKNPCRWPSETSRHV